MDSVENALIENLTFCFCGGHGIKGDGSARCSA